MIRIGSDLKISLWVGDTGSFSVSRTVDGVPTAFIEGDTVYFSVKTAPSDKVYKIHKSVTAFTDGKAVVEIDPEDTEDLKEGEYVWDIQVTDSFDRVSTLMSDFKVGRFLLVKGVTDE